MATWKARGAWVSGACLATAVLLSGCGGGGSSPNPVSAPASTTFWIPFLAQSTGAGGRDGVFVVPSQAPDTAPAFVAYANGAGSVTSIEAVAQASNGILTGGRLTAIRPAVIMYVGTDAQGDRHVYGLDLTDTTTPPIAKQISSLSLPVTSAAGAPPALLCDASPVQTDLTKPETLFVLLKFTATGDCHDDATGLYVVHWTDSAATAPVSVNLTYQFPSFTPFYLPTGTLAGMIIFDLPSGNVYYYSDDRFANPTRLLSGISDTFAVYPDDPLTGAPLTGLKFFGAALMTGSAQLFQVSSQGRINLVFTSGGFNLGGVRDDSNFYFSDFTGIWQLPLSGGTPMQIYAAGDQGTVESNGQVLLLDYEAGAGRISSQLSTIPLGVLSAAVTPIGPVFDGTVTAFFGATIAEDSSDDAIFVTEEHFPFETPDGTTPPPYPLTQVLTSTGSARTALTPYTSFTTLNKPADGAVYENTGLDQAGSGTVNKVDPSSLALTPVTLSTGEVCTPSDCDLGALISIASAFAAGPVNVGDPHPQPAQGVVLDVASNVIHTIDLPSTFVSTFVSPW